MSLSLAATVARDNSALEDAVASYTSPQKTHAVLKFALKKKHFRFGFGVFGGWG